MGVKSENTQQRAARSCSARLFEPGQCRQFGSVRPSECGRPKAAASMRSAWVLAHHVSQRWILLRRTLFRAPIHVEGLSERPMMQLEGTHIRFDEVARKKKTRVWMVMEKTMASSPLPIGAVAWYGPWRKYVFWPAPQTVFEQVCLREIATFCEDATREHKAQQHPAPASGCRVGSLCTSETIIEPSN